MNKQNNAYIQLVSVGVPAYNRPELLERALLHLTSQTWSNLEIIVSDNASTNPDVAKVIGEFAARDMRIRPFFQHEGLGVLQNFCFVLKQARANYFMWAADDDYLAPWFIERCMHVLISDPEKVLCTAETQYVLPDGVLMPMFEQGNAYRLPTKLNRLDRMDYLLKNNFDNMIYGLFRKDALINNDKILWDITSEFSGNEIPPLLLAAMRGEIIVLPEAGIYKTANQSVHAQAKWEVRGGRIPETSRIRSIKSLIKTWSYHASVIKGVDNALNQLNISSKDHDRLISVARIRIIKHFVNMVVRYKLFI